MTDAPERPDAPEADVVVDATLAARLLAEQHPDLDGPVRLVANGWDNAILRLGDELAIRMPRRHLAARLIEHEQRWLPELARRSPVPVPVPVRLGRPGAGYPFGWSITPWFDGRPAASAEVGERSGAATALAGFIAALQVPAPLEAPHNPYRAVPLAERSAVVVPRFDSAVLAAVAEPAVLREVWSAALEAPEWAHLPVWVHGDLHPGNLLLAPAAGGSDGSVGSDGSCGLAAVLDFGDLSAGDPASDLAAAWLCFDASGRARFRGELEARCGFGADDWARARGWAVAIGSAIVATAGVEGPIGRVGAHALAAVAED